MAELSIKRNKGRKDVEAEPDPRAQIHGGVADALCAFTYDEVANDEMVKVGRTMKTPRTEDLSLHGELVSIKSAQACVLKDEFRLQRSRKKAAKRKEAAQLLPAGKIKWENSAVIEQFE